MRREIEKMMRYRAISLVFAVLFCLTIVAIVAVVIIMNTGDYSGVNSDFGEVSASGETQTKVYELDKFDNVCFFSQDYKNERTLFTGVIPSVKVVNNNKYSVEVKTNKELYKNLKVFVDNKGNLVFGFNPELYGQTSEDDKFYSGLFVDCTTFDVTINAPVNHFRTHAEINLDYEAPKAENLTVEISGEARECVIKNVDCANLVVSFQGNSNATISGKATRTADISARHNSRVNAIGLECDNVYPLVTCQIFGFSYIEQGEITHYSLMGAGFVIALAMIIFPIIFIIAFAFFRMKFIKIKKVVDASLEEETVDKKHLKFLEKTEKNLLQKEE